MEVAIAVHGHDRIVPLVFRGVGDGFIDPRTAFIRVVLQIAIGIIVDGCNNMNGVGNRMNDDGCASSPVVVIG